MIEISNYQQFKSIFNNSIDIKQIIALIYKTIFRHKMNSCLNKNLQSYIFKKQNHNKLIKNICNIIPFDSQDLKILEKMINEYIRTKKINVEQQIKLQCDSSLISNLLIDYLSASPYFKLVKQELKKINNKKVPNTLTEILNANLQIGQMLPIGNDTIKESMHSIYVRPIIYINGNIIEGDENFTLNAARGERQSHSQVVSKYLNDMSLHKNDIMKMSADEWKNKDPYMIAADVDYNRAVTDGKIIMFLYPELNNNKIATLLHNHYNKPVFMITDNGTNIERIAQKTMGKRLLPDLIVTRVY